MKKTALIFTLVAGFSGTGCATIIEGNDQNVYFDSEPSGAKCSITREGDGLLYPEFTTPLSLPIERDKDQLVVICNKDGYKETTTFVDSNVEKWTAGNLILGGPLGVGIDAASGALNKYPSNVLMLLRKE